MNKVFELVSLPFFFIRKILKTNKLALILKTFSHIQNHGFIPTARRALIKIRTTAKNRVVLISSGETFRRTLISMINRSRFYTPFENRDGIVPRFKHRIFAFYLPQFHPFEENDRFWGKGFTEWTNVTKSFPLFEGHYQPRLPTDLGFYDLRNKATISEQAKIAKNYGLSGFAIHYYWFSGKKVMTTPIETIFSDPSIEIEYFISWANENWTRRWDGNESDILLQQLDKEDDYQNFFNDISKYFGDPRYLKINGSPVLMVYRAELLSNPKKAASIWRESARRLGYPGVHLVLSESFGARDPKDFDFDASAEFSPNAFPMSTITHEQRFFNKDFEGRVFKYDDVSRHSLSVKKDYPHYKTICLEWDNCARRGNKGTVVLGCDPAKFGIWLKKLLAKENLNNLVFINAWNEWAEGTYLEPDRRFGFAYLQQIYEGLIEAEARPSFDTITKSTSKKHNTAIYFHIHYFDVFSAEIERLEKVSQGHDLIFSITTNINQLQEEQIKSRFPSSTVYRVQNLGRDIRPFFDLLQKRCFSQYLAVAKIHTKKSPHRIDGNSWSSGLIEGVLHFDVESAQSNKNIAIWGLDWTIRPIKDHVGSNKQLLDSLSNEWGNKRFVAGTMFWFRPSSFERIAHNVDLNLFEPEPLETDGTFAHAVERLIGSWVMELGYEIYAIGTSRKSKSDYERHF